MSTVPLLSPPQDECPTASDSDFVLLTTAAKDYAERGAPVRRSTDDANAGGPHLTTRTTTALPRPRCWPLLGIAALVDISVTLALALRVPIETLPKSAVVFNLARSVVVGTVVTSPRIREFGPVILAQLAVSTLVLLFRLNELVQTSAAFSAPSKSQDRHTGELLNPTTEWYLSSFLCSCLHWLLFVTFVGVRRTRNPLAGRMKRSSTWGEQRWEGTQETVDPGLEDGSIRTRSSRGHRYQNSRGSVSSSAAGSSNTGGHGILSESEEDDSANELGNLSSEEEDEDDIIDIPRRYTGGGLTRSVSGALRHRASRASLLSTASSSRRAEEGRPATSPRNRVASGLGLVRNYGSINSIGERAPSGQVQPVFAV